MQRTTSSASPTEPLEGRGSGEIEPAPDDLQRILGAERAQAYRRFLEWSVGEGFLLAVVELRRPSQRDALVAATRAAIANLCEVRLDQIGDRPLRVVLEEACPSPKETSMLMLTHLEEARDVARICAQLNVHRNELAQRFALPWVLAAHPAAALRLQQIAPDFCDFAGLWLLDEPAADAELRTLELAIDAPAVRHLPSNHLGGGPGTSELLVRATVAISLGHLDEAADLLTQYDLDNPEARSNVAQRIRLEGRLHWTRGRPIEALACFERAMDRCEALGDPHGKAVLLTDIARIRELHGDIGAARSLAREALALFEQVGDRRGVAIVLMELASLDEGQADYVEARELSRRSVQMSEELGDRQQLAVSLYQLAIIEWRQGNHADAQALLRKSMRLNEELDNRPGRSASLHMLAMIARRHGRNEEARTLLRESLRITDELGDRQNKAASLHELALLAYEEGKNEEARALLRDSLRLAEEVGNLRGKAASLHQLALVEESQGNHAEAQALLRESLRLSEALGDHRQRAISLVVLGELEAAQGRVEHAIELVREGLGILEQIGAGDLTRPRSILRRLEEAPETRAMTDPGS